jgi:hypothetical protein
VSEQDLPRRFSVPRIHWIRNWLWAPALGGLWLTLDLVRVANHETPSAALIGFQLGTLLLPLTLLINNVASVTITDSALEARSFLGRRRTLRWQHIHAIRDFTAMGRYERSRVVRLSSPEGRVVLTDSLSDFDDLRAAIRRSAVRASMQPPTRWDALVHGHRVDDAD